MADTKETQGGTNLSGTATMEQGRGSKQEVGRQQGADLQGTAGGQGERGLARWRDPFTLMQRMSQEMDELFDSFFYGTPRVRGGRESALRSLWAPDVEVCEEQNRLRVLVDLPGVSKDNVKVDVHEGALTIQGARQEERSEGGEQEGYRRSERRYGSFYRTIPLPDGADAEQAQAHMKDGVLEVTLPMTPRKQARRLDIKG